MPPLSAVIFDFGGVLITPITRTFSRMAESFGIDGSVLREIVMGPLEATSDHPWHLAERGLLPVADIQAQLQPYADEHGVSLAGDEMERLLEEGHWSVNERMIEMVRRSRSRGLATAMLTNTFTEFRPTLERTIDLTLFDVVAESSRLGARKPDAEIYRSTLDELGLADAGRAVFLDDFAPNVASGEQVGLRTIHVTDIDDAAAQLAEILEEAP
ncbi:MAG: HAD family phosphatase [Actinomycetota bacterium]